MIRPLAVAFAAAIAASGAATGQSEVRRLCAAAESGEAVRSVEACSQLLANPALTPRERAQAYYNRGIGHQRLGNHDFAIRDYDAAIHIDPFHARAFRNRARVHFYRADFAAAAEDFRTAEYADRANAYSLLWRYVAEARSGTDDRAGLSAGSALLREGWPKPLVLHYLGRVNAEAVFAAAAADRERQRERECEAHFFIGQRHILAGAAGDAIAALRRALAACPHDMVEYHATRVELGRLGAPAQ